MAEGQLRLFVGVYPPERSAQGMLDALAGLQLPVEARHRVTPVEQVHLTLQFIGPTAVRELAEVIESLERSASGIGAFELAPRRLVTFPERGLPRLIAMETDAPAMLLELQRRLAQRLARKVRKKAGDRFRPHLTLARFAGDAHPPRVDEAVELPRFAVREAVLMKSLLLPRGAKHEAVARAALGG